MSKWLTGKKAFLKSHIIQFIVVLFIIGLIGIAYFNQTSFCSSNQVAAPVHPLWKINTSTVHAAIAWEYSLTRNDEFLAASKSSVAFYRSSSVNPCNDDETIIALNPSTGKEIWRYPVTILYSIFGYDGGYLIASCCTFATKLDKDGKFVWKTAEFPEKGYYSKFLINDNRVFFSSGDDHIIDFDTGSSIERNLTLEERNKFDLQYMPQYDVYLRMDQTKILVFHISNGLPVWDIHENFKAVPIISDNMVITSDQSNTIRLFRVADGKLLGEIQLTSDVIPSKNGSQNQFATLAAYGNTLFMLDSQTDKLIAIKLG